MLGSFVLASSAILGLASSCIAGTDIRPNQNIPHNGQYISANASNDATEWWWVQAAAPAHDGQGPTSFHVTFYQGYPLSVLKEVAGGANAPENYIVINGAFPTSGKTSRHNDD
ncbi:hypothetical protein BC628DRAFT_1339805 [Trametes gibbosa]|nr:hypothetical protein BC628DRAFT_1339805 [Trametes gibbosa]